MQPVPMPAPYAGVDKNTPVIVLQSPFAETLTNFNVTPAGIELRNGDSKLVATTLTNSGDFVYLMVPYSQSNGPLYLVTARAAEVRVYNGSTSATVFTTASGAAVRPDICTTSFFNNVLYIWANHGTGFPGISRDSAGVFAEIGYTYSTDNLSATGAVTFKRRQYIFRQDARSYYYTDVDQVTGEINKVDLASETINNPYLILGAPFSLADNVSAVSVMAFVFANGEVLFYTGSYPNSSSWALAGRAQIGPPINRKAIQFDGDALVLCDNGIFSMRELFLKGSQVAVNTSFSQPIEPIWGPIVAAYRALSTRYSSPIDDAEAFSGIWDSTNNRLVFCFPSGLDTNGALDGIPTFFIYNLEIKSWSIHRPASAITCRNAFFYKGAVQYTSSASATTVLTRTKEGSTGFLDRNNADSADLTYDYEAKSAPVASGRANVSKIEGMDVIVNSDLHAETNYQFVGDLGVQTTTAQKINAVPSGTLLKTFLNAGIEASYAQYKISGTTTTGKTVGYQLYGTNLWLSQGNAPR